MNSRSAFQQQIFKDKLTALYSTNRLSTIATIAVASTYIGVEWPHHDRRWLLVWISVLVAIYVYRYFLTKSYYRELPASGNQNIWLLKFRLVILMTGLNLGSTVVFFYPDDNVPRQMFTVLLLAGMAAGGLTVLVADVLCFTGYVISLLTPIIVSSMLSGDPFHYYVGALLSIFFVIMIRASRSLNDIVTSSLELRYENLSLVTTLEYEKNQLNNRLGRILNDSSNELYIVDAVSLNCLQVNKGAQQNLGYSNKELDGMNLLDIVVGHYKEDIEYLIEPLRLGTKESIIYKTRQKRKDGSTYPVEQRLQLSVQETPPVLVITALDITEQDEAERKLIHQANFDQLTNLPNRYYMLSHIKSAFARARRQHTKVSLLFMDLDNFKDINDTLGHAVGDELLKQVATRIQALLREVDTAARLGGDEFLIMLEGLNHQGQAEVVVNKIVNSFNSPFFVNIHEIYTSASVGISIYPDDADTVALIMQFADTAMYHAKQDNSCKYRFFSHELRAQMDEQLAIENRLRHAIRKNELAVYYQPKIDTRTQKIIGAEALIRWNNPDLGNVPPAVFIPVAEKYGLIEKIGSWVLQTACREASNWISLSSDPIHVAVNISPRQFRSSDFLKVIDDALAASNLPERLLEIEITESILMQDTSEPMDILNTLKEKNITLSLDDFGTGYSSLSYLKRFPLQVLKIDRSFIHDMLENRYNMSLVDAIIAMAQILDLRLVAEGVETHDQLAFLRNRNVEVVQGYLFSPPVPANEFQAMLTSSPNLPTQHGKRMESVQPEVR